MKSLLLAALLGTCSIANAVPNAWSVGSGMGYDVYQITSTEDVTLSVECNVGAGSDYDHAVAVYTLDKEYVNSDHEYPVSFMVDDKIALYPPDSTTWKNGAIAWDEFVENISTAKKIELFVYNVKMATFTPRAENIKLISSKLANCKSKW